MQATEQINVRVDTHATTGDHWDTMRPVDDYLREQVENMAACLRLARSEATGDDYDRLELDGLVAPEADPYESAREWIDAAFLSIEWARWIRTDNGEPDYLARVELCTGTGGPHTEIVAHFSRNGACERVEAHQFWSGHREAWTTDYRALSTLADFCSGLLALDES